MSEFVDNRKMPAGGAEGCFSKIKFQSGISAAIMDYSLFKPITSKVGTPDPAFGFGFCLSGKTRAGISCLKNELIIQGGQSAFYYFPEIRVKSEISSEEDVKRVSINIPPEKFLEFIDIGSSDFSGNEMPNSPEYTFNAGVQYRHSNGIFSRADLLGTGRMYGNVQNNSHVRLDAYELINLRCGYESDSYDIVFWCKNALDKEFCTSVFDYGDPEEAIGVAQNGEPRAAGVNLRYRF